jgi:Na+/proline symporter
MNPTVLLAVVIGYFTILLCIAWYTSRGAGEQAFYGSERKSLWWVLAFGMVGTSLSGVTFVSVPGWVRATHWNYLQMVLGFVCGYWIVAGILLPLYYRLQLISIYGYLEQRLGPVSYKSGSGFFIVSRLLGATLRIYVVLHVIHRYLLESIGLPFWLTAAAVMLMIFLYTLQGGVKTIVWTDTLQTLCMLSALVGTIIYIASDPAMAGWQERAAESGMMNVFNADWKSDTYFFKYFFSGVFMTIVMAGLDQEMMQKNLSARTLEDSQKNMRVFSIVLLITNALFLMLGVLLYLKADQIGLQLPEKSDDLFPTLALQYFPPWLGLLFIVGLISALLPSADGALTALTSSTCIDLIGIRQRGWDEARQRRVRKSVHFLIAVVFYFAIIWFYWRQDETIIQALYALAAITYGPLLGLFAFGLLTRRRTAEPLVPIVCLSAAAASYILQTYSASFFGGYQIGFETLLINGLLTFIGLVLISRAGGDRAAAEDAT